MSQDLTRLRRKWVPILKKETIHYEDLLNYREDLNEFKRLNPNWREEIVL